MKRKIVVFCLVFIQVFYTGVWAETPSSSFAIYLNEGFDQYATYTKHPEIQAAGTADAVIANHAFRDKGLWINKRNGAVSQLTYAFSAAAEDIIIQMDFMMQDGLSPATLRLSNSIAGIAPVNIDAYGKLRTGDGKPYANISADKWINIAIHYSLGGKYYSVYLNGQRVLDKWRLDNSQFKQLGSVNMEFLPTDKDTQIWIDNFRIYQGESLRGNSDFNKQAYNEQEVEYIETSYTAGEEVFVQHDYNTRLLGALTPKSNQIVQASDSDGNGYMKFEMAVGTDDSIVDNSLSNQAMFVVYQVDIRTESFPGNMELFTLKLNPDNTFSHTAYLRPGGTVTLYDGKTVGNIADGKWHNIAAAYNFYLKSFDFYIDHKLVSEAVPMKYKDKALPFVVRISCFSAGEEYTLDMDNLLVYEGKSPRELETVETLTGLEGIGAKWPKDENAQKILAGKLAFHAASGVVFANGSKSYPEPAAFMRDKVVYLPLRTIVKYYNQDLKWNDDEGYAVLNGATIIKPGDTQIETAEKTLELSAPVLLENNYIYIPVSSFGKEGLMGKNVYTNWDGVVVFDWAGNMSSADDKLISAYLMNRRPKAAQLQADFNAAGMSGQHPRVIAKQEDFERAKELIKTDSLAAAMYQKVLADAERYMLQPPNEYVLPDGVRLLTVSRSVLDRMIALGIAYHISGDEKYAQRAYEELEAVAQFPDWHPVHYLDTGEMAAGFGVGYDWFYNVWTEEQKALVREAMVENGINVYLKSYENGGGWTVLDSNWSFVCNGGGIMLASALADDYPDESFTLIENALRSMEYAFPRFSPDGGWYEGPGYWDYSMIYLNYLMPTIQSTFAKDYDLSKNPGFDETLNFYLNMSGAKYYFAYSDAGQGKIDPWESFWLADVFQKPDWAILRANYLKQNPNLCNNLEMLFYRPEMIEESDGNITLPLDTAYRNVDVAVHRDSWENPSLYLAYKGGFASQSHGHMDSGSFVLDLNGVRWAEDLGKDDYNLPNYRNYSPFAQHYRVRAEGHNTLVINPQPDENDQDPNAVSKLERIEGKSRGGFGIVNLDDIYRKNANSVRRGFQVADERNSVIIRDEINLKQENSTIYWFMHTNIEDASKISIDGNSAVLTDETGKQLYLTYITNASSAQLLVMDAAPLDTSPHPDKQANNPGKKIAIVLNGSGDVNLTVKMSDYAIRDYIAPVEDTPIDDWYVPDGDLEESPKLLTITKDNQPLEQFNPKTTYYMVYSYYDEADPVIAAQPPEGCELTVVQQGNNYLYSVYRKDAPLLRSTYTVTVKKIPHVYNSLDDFVRLEPQKTTASRIPQKENPPENVLDGNLNTRFAVDGDGEWIELDMGKVISIDAYAVAYYQGLVRDSYYDILVSEDGVNYHEIFKGETSGLTEAYEVFMLPDKVKLRYFRLVGHKNSVGDWNSPTEIALLQERAE